jgi:hypothetical protein
LLWQRYAGGEAVGGQLVGLVLLAHDDLEPALAVADDSEHLVLRARDVGPEDVDGLAHALGLGADAVDAAGALLDGAGVPAQVVVDDVAAVEVQVDSPAGRQPP